MTRKKKKIILIMGSIFLAFFIFLVSYQIIIINKAHETLSGYCKWRKLEVVSQSSSFGVCRDLNTSREYKIVSFEGKWYLDGDLPCGFLCF